MYTLLSKNLLRSYRINSKSIKRYTMIINDLSTVKLLPLGSKVLVFFEHSIDLTHLLDLQSALNLDLILVTNNQHDFDLCSTIFQTKLIKWDFIDGDLVNSILLNDEKQIDELATNGRPKMNIATTDGLIEEAKRLSVAPNSSESIRLLASAFLNMVSVNSHLDSKYTKESSLVDELRKKNLGLESSLANVSSDMDTFIKTYKIEQAQLSARNVIDVIKDTSKIELPSSITSLVIKNFGIPHLTRFVLALKDALIASYDRHTKIVYIAEPDSVSIQEINRSQFFLMTDDTKASDLLKNDLLLCVGNTREPIEFLTTSSNIDVLIIIDSRRTTNELISGQTLTMYTAMDIDAAINLNLEPSLTITSSEKSLYTIKESDFVGKKRHALRNNDLVTRVANTLLGGG